MKLGSFILLCVLFFVPLVFSTGTYDNFALHKAVFFHGAAACLAVCVSFNFARNKETRHRFIFSPVALPLLVFFLLSTFSLVISPDLRRSFLGVYQRFDGYYHFTNLILFYVCAVFVLVYADLSYFVIAIMMSSFLAASYAALQHLGMDVFLWRSLDRRSISTFGHANTLAGYLSMVFPFALSEYLFPIIFQKSSVYRMFCLFLCVLLFFALLTTFSRAGYVAWLCGSVFLLLMLAGSPFLIRKASVIRVSALLVCFGACALFVQVQSNRNVLPVTLKERVFSLADVRESTIRERFLIWESTFKIIRRFPLMGCGFESLKSVFPEFKSKELARMGSFYVADKAHNEYFHIAATTGLGGLFAYLWLLFSVLLTGWSAILKHRNENARNYGFSAMFCSALVAYSINVFFGFSTIATQVYFYFIMAGLSAFVLKTMRCPEEGNNFKKISLNTPGKILLVFLSMFFLLVTVSWSALAWKADAYYKKSADALPSSAERALSFLEQSVRLNPLESEYGIELARQYSSLYAQKHKAEYFHKAMRLYRTLLKQNARDVDVMHFYAVLLAYHGKNTRQPGFLRDAVYVLRKAHAFSPNYPLYLVKLGEIYFDLAAFENASVNLEKALQAATESFSLEPPSYDLQFLLVKIYYRQKKYEDSLNQIQAILVRHPQDNISYIWMGNIYQETGKFHEAVRAYEFALKTSPSFPAGVLMEMGKAYLSLDDARKARQCFEQALWHNPGYAAARAILEDMTKRQ